jgi:riboflavin biosynthesis pyrimidine reductase
MTNLSRAGIVTSERPITGLASPLEVLVEAPDDLLTDELPEPVQSWYGGPLGFTEPRLVANFVATLDGVVAVPGLTQSNKLISGGSAADRFVMGLLRAFADVVLIGSGTLHGSPRTVWTGGHAYPPADLAFAELRKRRGRPPIPELAVITASGKIDVDHPALHTGAVVLTTERGANVLHRRLPYGCKTVVLPGTTAVDPNNAVQALAERGHRLVLSEAGPSIFGSMLAAGLIDELFLTQSPLVAGRPGGSPRLGLIEGVDLLAATRHRVRLTSLRRHGEHLFLRYTFDNSHA